MKNQISPRKKLHESAVDLVLGILKLLPRNQRSRIVILGMFCATGLASIILLNNTEPENTRDIPKKANPSINVGNSISVDQDTAKLLSAPDAVEVNMTKPLPESSNDQTLESNQLVMP